jgi:hypothetical protein
MGGNSLVVGGVVVEVLRLGQSREHCGVVREQHCRLVDLAGRSPIPVRMAYAQVLRGLCHPSWLLRAVRAAELLTCWIVYNDHGLQKIGAFAPE